MIFSISPRKMSYYHQLYNDEILAIICNNQKIERAETTNYWVNFEILLLCGENSQKIEKVWIKSDT